MSRLSDAFNRSRLSHFLNRPAGRVFRAAMGVGFLVVGYIFRSHPLGVASIVWGLLPLSAGALDICYLSALLGGPISAVKIRTLFP